MAPDDRWSDQDVTDVSADEGTLLGQVHPSEVEVLLRGVVVPRDRSCLGLRGFAGLRPLGVGCPGLHRRSVLVVPVEPVPSLVGNADIAR